MSYVEDAIERAAAEITIVDMVERDIKNGTRCAKFSLRPDLSQRRVYCDMDGVLADFSRGYLEAFGKFRQRHTGWDDIRSVPNFFLNLKPMPDAHVLWEAIKPKRPIILTGTPSSVDQAGNDKVLWARKQPFIGEGVPVQCCKARDKWKFCQPGDVLIDDSVEYRPLWEKAGGVWITHVNASLTIYMLRARGVLP